METKAFYKSSEAWASLFAALYAAANTTGVIDQVPKSWSSIALALIVGLYSVARGQAKSGVKPDPTV
jgi:hypothetical protein